MNPGPRSSMINSFPPYLPPDLYAAVTAADFLASRVDLYVEALRGACAAFARPQTVPLPYAKKLARGAIRDLIRLERRMDDSEQAILRVSNELTAANRAPVRLPALAPDWLLEPNAHQATISIAQSVLDAVVDDVLEPHHAAELEDEATPIRRWVKEVWQKWRAIALEVSEQTWPDWTSLREALLLEAATAAHQRTQAARILSTAALPPLAGVPTLPVPREHTADEPVAPQWLRWRGKLVRIGTRRSRLCWQLLDYFWTRPSATFQELQGPGKPWPDPVSESAIATAVNRFNTVEPADFPWRLATKAYWVFKESRENPLV